MRQCTEKGRQNIDLFVKGQAFVDDKAFLIFHDAETGFGIGDGFLQILLGYGDLEFISQFGQRKIYLIGFHGILMNCMTSLIVQFQLK